MTGSEIAHGGLSRSLLGEQRTNLEKEKRGDSGARKSAERKGACGEVVE